MPRNLLALLLPLLVAAPALGQSCPDRNSACVERLYELDEALFMYEIAAAKGLGEAARCLEADTDAWRAAMMRSCMGPACFEAALIDRVAVIEPLAPGVAALQGWDRPAATPRLVAVLAPEENEAIPKDFTILPTATFTGALVHARDDMNHMGLALQLGPGDDHVIVFDMEIGNQPGHATLQSLIEDGRGSFIVRGRTEWAGGAWNFNTSQCRFVYRIPQ